jgi:hypothetical protein
MGSAIYAAAARITQPASFAGRGAGGYESPAPPAQAPAIIRPPCYWQVGLTPRPDIRLAETHCVPGDCSSATAQPAPGTARRRDDSRTPPTNCETPAALAYRNASKYVPSRERQGAIRARCAARSRLAAYVQDPAQLPLPYKIYETLSPIPLSRHLPPTTLAGPEALARTGTEPCDGEAMPDSAALVTAALFSNSPLGRKLATSGDRTTEHRTAGGAGPFYSVRRPPGDVPPGGLARYPRCCV